MIGINQNRCQGVESQTTKLPEPVGKELPDATGFDAIQLDGRGD